MRSCGRLLAVALAAGALAALKAFDRAKQQDDAAFAALNGTGGDAATAVKYYSQPCRGSVESIQMVRYCSALALSGDLQRRTMSPASAESSGNTADLVAGRPNFHFQYDSSRGAP